MEHRTDSRAATWSPGLSASRGFTSSRDAADRRARRGRSWPAAGRDAVPRRSRRLPATSGRHQRPARAPTPVPPVTFDYLETGLEDAAALARIIERRAPAGDLPPGGAEFGRRLLRRAARDVHGEPAGHAEPAGSRACAAGRRPAAGDRRRLGRGVRAAAGRRPAPDRRTRRWRHCRRTPSARWRRHCSAGSTTARTTCP